MTWAHWVLVILPIAWAGFMLWVAFGPISADDWDDDEQDAALAAVELEDVLGPYTVTIPVDGDQLAIDRRFYDIIEQGYR